MLKNAGKSLTREKADHKKDAAACAASFLSFAKPGGVLQQSEKALSVRFMQHGVNRVVQRCLLCVVEWAARNAKAEALLRAFEASGSTLEQFADMYGMDPRSTGQQLERARKLAAAAQGNPSASAPAV